MSEKLILTYADKMIEDMRGAIELAHLPGGPQSLEREMLDATTIEITDIASLARLMSIAHAAFVVADAGIEGITAPWYREIGLRLLRRSTDALTMIEAISEPRPTAGLN